MQIFITVLLLLLSFIALFGGVTTHSEQAPIVEPVVFAESEEMPIKQQTKLLPNVGESHSETVILAAQSNGTDLPPVVINEVPFVVQAPFANWDDPIQQDGCEEASLLMAYGWLNGLKEISSEEALAEILAMAEYQKQRFGYYRDTSVSDSEIMFREYFADERIEFVEEPTLLELKQSLASGKLILSPINGQTIGNPNFTGEGPDRHFLIVIGYDDFRGVFVTHDPGTRNGANYTYPYQRFYDSIRDYPSGYKNPITEDVRRVLLVSR